MPPDHAATPATERLFVALDMPDAAVDTVRQVQHSITADLGEHAGTPIAPQQLHLTIAFLGERTHAQRRTAGIILSESAADISPLRMQFDGLATYGARSVLALNLAGPGLHDLRRLHDHFVDLAAGAGLLRRDQPDWRPHVSIMRRHLGRYGAPPRQHVSDTEFVCDRVTLYASVPHEGRYRHEARLAVDLGR